MKIQTVFVSLCLLLNTAFAQPDYRVLGIGTAAIDLLVQVEDNFFEKHGLGEKGGGMLCDAEMIDQIVGLSGVEPKIVPGGSTANTMRALAKLGEKSGYFSHIGKDALGHHFAHHIGSHGVVDRLLVREDLSTAKVLCIITPDGQRTFRAFDPPIHNISLDPDHFTGVSLVHLEARQINHGLSLQRALEYAKEAGATISLDLSSFEIVRGHRKSLNFLISEYVDIVFCNEDEIREFIGLSAKEACLELAKTCSIVVVTQGEKGCLLAHGDKVYTVPTFAAKVIDTTGAGDHFAAGFLYGYLNEMPLVSCARLGNLLGSAIVEVVGAQLPDEKWDEIRTLVLQEVSEKPKT